MATFTTHITSSPVKPLTGKRPRLKLLSKPTGHVAGMAQDNIGYQMQYSAKVLEERLEAEGTPHVLQLNLDWEDDDWRNPSWWHLYADGTLVLEGDGEYARSCFVSDEEAFLTALREGVEAAGLPGLSQDEYRLLYRARDIARHEPHDAGSHELGGTPGRVF